MTKKQKDDFYIIRAYLLMRGVKYYADFMRFLTQYPPFSFFWKDRFFHYENKDIRISREKIHNLIKDIAWGFEIRIVERDPYFLTLIGRFRYTNKKIQGKKVLEEIAGKLEKEDIFLRPLNKGFVKILVKRSKF